MDRIQSINADRIRWCAAERGLSVEQAALEAGLSVKAVNRLFDEGTGLTFNQLKKLADFFGRGALFFLDSGPVDEERVHSVQYRTLTNQKPQLPHAVKRLIERVERQRELFVSLREDLHEDDLPRFAPPTDGTETPAQAARTVRSWLRLGEVNDFASYRRAVEARGILVFRTNGYAGNWQIAKDIPILGFALYSDVCPVIVVKKSRWETQQSFTLMHELGHIILHRASSIDDDTDMRSVVGRERDANAFAGQLLVPDSFLALISDSDRPDRVEHFDKWLSGHRQRWGVSTEVILRRLLDAGRLADDLYNEYRAHVQRLPITEEEGGSRAYRHREPKHMFGDPFVRTVLQALSSRRITANKASTYLDGLKLSDLQLLERHVAGH